MLGLQASTINAQQSIRVSIRIKEETILKFYGKGERKKIERENKSQKAS
jgi:hypothetical protein